MPTSVLLPPSQRGEEVPYDGPPLKQKIAPPADPNTPVINVPDPDRSVIPISTSADQPSENQGTSSDEGTPKLSWENLIPAKTPEQANEEQRLVVEYFKDILYSGDSPAAAEAIISDMVNKTGEFGKGGSFENIDHISTSGMLEQLENDFPDIHPFAQEVQEVTPDTTFTPEVVQATARLKNANISPALSQAMYGSPVRPYDVGIEQIKAHLRKKKFAEDHPVVNLLDQAYTATKEGFSDIVPAINRVAWNSVNLVGQALEGWTQLRSATNNLLIDPNTPSWDYIKDAYNINGIKPAKPTSFTGMLTEAGVEGYVAYATGRPVYNLITPIFSKWIPKLAGVLNTPGAKIAGSESLGGGLITSPEERWATMFHDLGMDNDMVTQLAHTSDEGVFEKRYYSWVDATYGGMAFASVNPMIKALGKSVFFLQDGIRKGYALWNKPEFEELLNATSGYMTKIRQAYPKKQADRVPIQDVSSINTLGQLGEIMDLTDDAIKQFGGDSPTKIANKERILKVLEEEKLLDESILVPNISTSPFLRNVEELTTDEISEMVLNIDRAISYKAGVKKKKGKQAWKKNQTQKIFNLDFLDKATDDDVGKAVTAVADQIIKTGAFKNVNQSHLMTTVQGEEVIGLLKSTYETALGPEVVDHIFSTWAKGMEKAPAMVYALNHYIKEAVGEVNEIAFKYGSILDEGGALTNEQSKNFAKEYLKAASRLHMKGNLGRSLGRAIDANRINGVNLDDNLIESFASKDGQAKVTEIIRNIRAADGDPSVVANIVRRNRMAVGFDIFRNLFINGLLSGPKTLTSIPVGIFSFTGLKHAEGWASAGMSWLTRRLYKKNFTEGVTKGEMSAEAFGFQQATLEMFAGRGYYERSPIAAGKRAFRSLDSGAEGGTLLDVDALKGTTTGKVLGIPGEFKMQNGLSEQALYDLFPDVPQEQVADFIKQLFNTAGFWSGVGGRAIVAEDALFRTFLERMAVHRESYILAKKRVIENLEAEPKWNEVKKKDDKYNFFRGEWEGQKGIREEFKNSEEMKVMNEYFKVIQNPTPLVLKRTKAYAREGLMQNEPDNIVKFVNSLTTNTNSTPNGGRLDDVLDFSKNVGRLYATTKFAFAPTMSNIWKQSLTERGAYKLLKSVLSPTEFKKAKNSERYLQEVVSKTLVGGSVQVAGVGLAYGLSMMGYEFVMEGIEANTQEKQYLRSIQGRHGAEVILIDKNTGEKHIVNIDRLDTIKQPLVLGAIFGTYLQAYNEAIEEYEKLDPEGARGMKLEHQEEIEELNKKLAFSIGKLLFDMPIGEGVMDTLNLIPGFGARDWDISKEAGNFFGEVAPWNSTLKSARSGWEQWLHPFKRQKFSDQQGELIPVGDDKVKKTIKDGPFESKEDWQETLEPSKLGTIRKIVNRMMDLSMRVGLIDNSDPLNPKAGALLYHTVDPGGRIARFLPNATESELKQALDSMVFPVKFKTLNDHPVTQLIDILDVPYENPKYWETAGGMEKFLNAEQRFTWTVLAGQMNERDTSDPRWNKVIRQLRGVEKFVINEETPDEEKLDLMSKHPRAREEREILKEELKEIIHRNREIALIQALEGSHEGNVLLNIMQIGQ